MVATPTSLVARASRFALPYPPPKRKGAWGLRGELVGDHLVIAVLPTLLEPPHKNTLGANRTKSKISGVGAEGPWARFGRKSAVWGAFGVGFAPLRVSPISLEIWSLRHIYLINKWLIATQLGSAPRLPYYLEIRFLPELKLLEHANLAGRS